MPPQRTEFRDLLEAVPHALVGVDTSGVIQLVNHHTESLFGYGRDELFGSSLETLVPDRLRRVHVAHREAFGSAPRDRPMGTNLRLIGRRRGGTEFPVDIALPTMDTGEGTVVIASVRDMGDHLQAEANRARRDRLAAIVEHSDDAIISSTLDGTITSWNPAAEKLYGYTGEEIIGKSTDLLSPKDRVGDIEAIVGKIKAGEHVEHHHTTRVRKDGTLVRISLTASPIRDAGGAIIGATRTARDLTRQEEASEIVRSMIEASQDSMVAISPQGKITNANEATVKLTGVRRDKLIGTSFSQYFTDPQKAEEGYQKVFEQGSVTDYPLTLHHQNGREMLTEVVYNASLYRDTEGKVLGVFPTARDVTALRKSAQYARPLIEAALDPLVIISPEGMITDVNEATVKATGVHRDRLIGTDFSDYFTDPVQASRGYQQVLEQGSVFEYPLTLRHRDGTLSEVLYNASVYRDGDGNVLGVFAAARDVTKQVQAQREIAEQQARELDRLADLERFQRVRVGRELKMIELKKEIEYLRNHVPAEGGENPDNNR